MRLRPLCISLPLLGVACIPTPEFGGTAADSASPYDPTDPYVPGDTDPFNPQSTDGGSSSGGQDSAGTDGGPSGSTGDAAGTGGVSDTDGSTGEDDGGPVGSFDPPVPFGDDPAETALVGTWGAPWDPFGLADVTLTVGEDGTFEWRETSADCSEDKRATGVLWVEGTQLVMHVESWDKRMPWDTKAEIGVKVYTPFRLRLGYNIFSTYLGLAGPRGITENWDWQGRSYDRVDPGTGAQGRWASEAELWALVDGPQLIVRERFYADLLGGSNATVSQERTWYWPGPDPVGDAPEVVAGQWTDLNPGSPAGQATVNGRNHIYDAAHLFTFASGQSLKYGIASDCVP